MPGARVATTERLTLRTFEREDLEFVQRSHTNPELRHPMGSPVMNQQQLDGWLDDGSADRLVVCLDEAGPGDPDADEVRRLGLITVEGADWKRPQLTYWLIPEVHGEGYGREAVSRAIGYVFRAYDTPAVGAGAYDSNEASRALLESLGFQQEGRCRKFMFIDGEHRDMIYYGLLREAWRERRGTQ